MKGAQSSTMPRFTKVKLSEITDQQRAIFGEILELLKPYSKLLDERVNTKEHFELWTNHGFRSQSFHPKIRKGLLFAGLLILKKNIGLYLFALHIDEKFNEKISPVILPLSKGGSAFQIDKPLSDLEREKLRDLFRQAWEYYEVKGWVG